MRTLILLAIAAATPAVSIAAAAPTPNYTQIGRGRAMVSFHNGCVVDYRAGQRKSVSRYCTAQMTTAADNRAALGGAFRVNAAIAAPLVVRLGQGAVQVGFAGVACNYLFDRRGRLTRAMGSYCTPALQARATELQSRVAR